MKDFAFKLFPFASFLAFLVKCIVIPATLADSIIICALVSYIILESLRLTLKQTKELKEIIQNFQDQLIKNETDIKNVQNNVNGVKLGLGVKSLMPTKNG